MRARKQLPCALTVAGSDSGGGAGIEADLKTFAALGVHGTCALTCITAQNPRRVKGVQPSSPDLLRRQLEAVFEEFRPRAVKTGMLYSEPLLRVTADFFRRREGPPLVVDPVMVASSGASLLQPAALRFLCRGLLPQATLLTPNLREAELLTGRTLVDVEGLRQAARELHGRFGCAALVKGGHLLGVREAADIFYDGKQELLLRAPFVRGLRTHGTGCTYSAAIAAFLARGLALPEAVGRAKQYITDAIAGSVRVGAHTALDWLGAGAAQS